MPYAIFFLCSWKKKCSKVSELWNKFLLNWKKSTQDEGLLLSFSVCSVHYCFIVELNLFIYFHHRLMVLWPLLTIKSPIKFHISYKTIWQVMYGHGWRLTPCNAVTTIIYTSYSQTKSLNFLHKKHFWH